MSRAFGAKFADKWIDACVRAVNFAPVGGGRRCPRSARVQFAATPQRLADCPEVRAASAWLIKVADQLRPGHSKVAAGSKLWIGHGRKFKGKAWAYPTGSLAAKMGRSPRQLARYAAIARTAGILENIQPPASRVSDQRLKSRRSGHAYAMYQFVQAVPRELQVRLARHYRVDKGFGAPSEPPRPESVVQAERGPLSASARAFAAALPRPPPPE